MGFSRSELWPLRKHKLCNRHFQRQESATCQSPERITVGQTVTYVGQPLDDTEQRKDEMDLRANKPRTHAICFSPGLENTDLFVPLIWGMQWITQGIMLMLTLMHGSEKENGVIQFTPLYKCKQWQSSLRTLIQFIISYWAPICCVPCNVVVCYIYDLIDITFFKKADWDHQQGSQ